MAAVQSTMLPLNTKAPDFQLPNIDGNFVSRDDFQGKPLLIMFICNHCPFVKHIQNELSLLGKNYQDKVGIVAISSNDVTTHPDDSPEKMIEEAKKANYLFPYLYDETQSVAKEYTAACTPDFFLFNQNHLLVYRGQLDDSRPGNDIPVTGKDLREALDAVILTKKINEQQKPSIGCNIKWKKGNEPDYFKTLSA